MTSRINAVTLNIHKYRKNWKKRAVALKHYCDDVKPDIMGLQETQRFHIPGINAALPNHRKVISTPSGRGQLNPIYYDATRWELKTYGQYKLDADRVCVWGFFGDFVVANTHLDHRDDGRRLPEAKNLVKNFPYANYPAILLGDFNAHPESDVAQVFWDAGFVNTYDESNPDIGSFGNYGPGRPGKDRIDWVLTRPGAEVSAGEVHPYEYKGQYISDHHPVFAQFSFPEYCT